MSIITLLTDFGTADGYVGEMKGVLLSECPGATIVDITHDVAAHDVDAGRLTLARYWRRFPPGTVHLAVVDPGVGSPRAALAVASDGRLLVGPDNGVLSPALLMTGVRAAELPVPAHSSATFHGRDVFAPAAARLASGVPVDDLGPPAQDPIVRRTPEPHRDSNGNLIGEVIAIDHFGNAITNLLGVRLDRARILIGSRELRLHRTYSELDPGALGALVGSSGLVEIVQQQGRAADTLALRRGDRVTLG